MVRHKGGRWFFWNFQPGTGHGPNDQQRAFPQSKRPSTGGVNPVINGQFLFLTQFYGFFSVFSEMAGGGYLFRAFSSVAVDAVVVWIEMTFVDYFRQLHLECCRVGFQHIADRSL